MIGRRPKVAVFSAFYNRAPVVAESVGSLIAQTLADLAIVIIDDGSRDDTAAELAKLHDPRLRVVDQANTGFTRAMNRAIAAHDSDYIAIHGSGDISAPDRLARQAAYLDANPDVGLVGCLVLARGATRGQRDGKHRSLRDMARTNNVLSHGEVMFRRSLFERVGGYRELFRFAQDRDLWLRMGEHCDYAVLQEVLYERRNLDDGVSRKPEQIVLQKRLAWFAVQCSQMRQATGADPLQRYGASGFLLATAPAALVPFLVREGLAWVRDGRVEGGNLLLAEAWRERRSPLTALARATGRAARNPAVQKVLTVLLQRISR
jgi:glycosyltransferase involved in cell wall biosynthesis